MTVARPTAPSPSLPAPGPAIQSVQHAMRGSTVGPREAAARGQDLGSIVVAGLAGFAIVYLIVRLDRGSQLDIAVTRAVQRWHAGPVQRAMEVVSWPGFPPQSRILPAGVVAGWLVAGLRVEAVVQAMGWGSALLATALKVLARRPRPIAPQVNVVIAPLGGTSFPSGHVLSYVGTYGMLAFLLSSRVKDRTLRRMLLAPPLALVALVGPSRIHQGHHWLTDVLASYLLGMSYVAALAAVYRRWLRRDVPA
jgi:PAP2 superfamily protein